MGAVTLLICHNKRLPNWLQGSCGNEDQFRYPMVSLGLALWPLSPTEVGISLTQTLPFPGKAARAPPLPLPVPVLKWNPNTSLGKLTQIQKDLWKISNYILVYWLQSSFTMPQIIKYCNHDIKNTGQFTKIIVFWRLCTYYTFYSLM